MKTKYERMNKEEKRKIINKYKDTELGKVQMNRLKRLNVVGGLCILYAVVIILLELNNLNTLKIVFSILMVIIGLFFLISSYILKKRSINNYIIKK